MDRIDIRVTEKFKAGVIDLANKEGMDVTDLIKKSLMEHENNLRMTIKILKKLIPDPENVPERIKKHDEWCAMWGLQ